MSEERIYIALPQDFKAFDKYNGSLEPQIKQKIMKYVTRDREAGNVIDRFATEEEAINAIESYEQEDKNNDEYTPNFYEIIEIE